MASVYVLCGLTMLLSVLIVYLENNGNLTLKYILKSVASLCFVFIAILCLIQSNDFYSWKGLVLGALILGMLGDIFLSSENIVPSGKDLGKLTLAGGIFFAVGHIIYVIWLLNFVESFNYWLLFIVGGLPVLLLILSSLKIMDTNKLLLPVTLYAAFLGLMLAASVNVYSVLNDLFIGKFILVGGILFTISDLVLAYFNFGHKNKTYVKYLYMPAYYIAQIFFALTLLF